MTIYFPIRSFHQITQKIDLRKAPPYLKILSGYFLHMIGTKIKTKQGKPVTTVSEKIQKNFLKLLSFFSACWDEKSEQKIELRNI